MNLVVGLTIPPGIDLDALGEAMIKAFHEGLVNLANAAMNKWKDLAGAENTGLHRTRRQYQEAIHTHMVDDEEIEVILHHPKEDVNWLVTALEVGVPSFKLKPPRLSGHAGSHWSSYSGGGAKPGLPFVDIPFRTGAAKEQAKPDKWRRMTEASPAKWVHPGFRPAGGGGLKSPLREKVKEYIEKQAEITFSPLLSRIRL